MPIEVTCELPDEPSVIERLRACSAIDTLLATSVVSNGKRVLDVRALALVEDIYGRTNTFDPADVLLWGAHRETEVFSPADLDMPELAYVIASGSNVGALGELNVDFICWLKAVTETTESRLTLSYLHERGDYPYETACWEFDFRPPAVQVETFALVSWDGNDEPEWTRRVSRRRDGEIVRGHRADG